MPHLSPRRSTGVLGGIVGSALLLLGVAEFVTRLSEPWPLLFWLPTLWGGGTLVLVGVFGVRGRPRLALVVVVVGVLLGFLPTVWTVVLPLLSVVLVVMMAKDLTRADVEHYDAAPPAP